MGDAPRPRRPRALAAATGVAVCTLFALGGCSTLDYYWQGARGEYEILHAAEPLDAAIGRTEDARLRQRLVEAKEIRDFASARLDLPDNGSYRRYSDLGRSFVLWNIFATPELSLQPVEWCYPVAGCVNYRGFFNETDARAQADKLRAAGNDVYIGGVPAYSTLGWFDDPILSTFVRYPETEFARLIFHELAHQLLYVQGDTVFNESFASTVELVGVNRWIAAQPPEAQARLAAEQQRSERLRAQFRALVLQARVELAAVYASDLPTDRKRERKRAILAALRADYDSAKAGEPGLAGFERWFAADGGPNNASLAAVALYTDRVPQFQALLAEEQGDLQRFYARVKALAALPKPERDARLDALAPRAAFAASRPGGA